MPAPTLRRTGCSCTPGFGFADAAASSRTWPARRLAPLPLAGPAGRARLDARLRRRRPHAGLRRARRPRRARGAGRRPPRARARHRRRRRAQPHGDRRRPSISTRRSGTCCARPGLAVRALVRRRLGGRRRTHRPAGARRHRSTRSWPPGRAARSASTTASRCSATTTTCFPLAPGTRRERPGRPLLAAQHYALACWRDKDERAQLPPVLRRRLADRRPRRARRRLRRHPRRAARPAPRRASIDGLRIDHPDGLADPEGYLERLRDAHRRRLGRRREDPRAATSAARRWPCAGTTGLRRDRAPSRRALVPAGRGRSSTSAGRPPAASRRSSASSIAAKRQVVRRPARAGGATARAARPRTAARRADRSTATSPRRRFASCSSHVEVYRAYVRPGYAGRPASRCARLDADDRPATPRDPTSPRR